MTFTNDDDPQPRMVQMPRKDVKRLEEQAKKAKDLEQKVAEMERERAFVQAGVPLEDPRAQYFVRGYQGEHTAEAIRTEWQTAFAGSPAGGRSEQEQQVEYELGQLTAAQDAATAAPNISLDKLAERDQKLAALNPNDPRLGEKFDAIFEQYGGKRGGLVG